MLNLVEYGEQTKSGAPPLVIAHGLFGSARNWGALAKRLGEGRRVLAADLRCHGDSFAGAMDYRAMAADLAAVIGAEAGGRADLLGHSMGGKAAMALALTEPARVGRLVVADIAPVAYGHSQIEYVEALRAVDLGSVRRRADADRMLAEQVPEAALRAFFLQSLSLGPEGARWKLDLDRLAAGMPDIMGFPAFETAFDGPVLFLTGERSDYVGDEHWPEIRRLFPRAEHAVVAGAGHWLHAEAPEAVLEAVEGFLGR